MARKACFADRPVKFADAAAARFALRERAGLRAVGTEALLALSAAAVLGTIGPFGTFGDLGVADRYLYWLAIVGMNWLQIALPIELGMRLLGDRPRLFWSMVVSTALVASVLASVEVRALEAVFRPERPVPDWFTLYFYVAVLTLPISLAVSALLYARRPAQDTALPEPGVAPRPPALLKRIPRELGQELWCLESEDHYLRLHTPLGSGLILLRLSDALGEVAGLDGLRVHRSWWVARAAVSGLERSGRKASLILKNGAKVPISRSYLRELREAGWLNKDAFG